MYANHRSAFGMGCACAATPTWEAVARVDGPANQPGRALGGSLDGLEGPKGQGREGGVPLVVLLVGRQMPLGECTCSSGWRPGKTLVSSESHTAIRNLCKIPQCVHMGCAGASMSAWEAGACSEMALVCCTPFNFKGLRTNCHPQFTAVGSRLLSKEVRVTRFQY
jgi:hypothetical protein